nr:hypothetical protein GCM10025732_52450 [Glycomyces mayteni]
MRPIDGPLSGGGASAGSCGSRFSARKATVSVIAPECGGPGAVPILRCAGPRPPPGRGRPAARPFRTRRSAGIAGRATARNCDNAHPRRSSRARGGARVLRIGPDRKKEAA